MAIYLIDYENTGVKGLHGIEKLKEDDLVVIFYGPKTGAVPFDEHVRISTSASHVEYIKTTKTAKNYLDFQLTTYLGYLIAQTVVRDFKIVSKDSGYDSAVDFWTKKGIRIKRQENVAGEKKAVEKKTTEKKTAEKNNTANNSSNKKNKKETKNETKNESKVAEIAAVELESAKAEAVIASPEVVAEAEKETAISEKKAKTVPESIRKKIRAALKAENPHAGVYRAIYACMIDSTDKQTFNTALVRQFTQEMGNKYYKAVVPAFSEWLKHS